MFSESCCKRLGLWTKGEAVAQMEGALGDAFALALASTAGHSSVGQRALQHWSGWRQRRRLPGTGSMCM